MSITTQNTTGSFTGLSSVKKTQSIVEIKFSGQETGEALALCPQVSLTSCEASSGRINYSGRIVCTLVYADGDNKLCRIQKGAEFAHHVDGDEIAPADKTDCILTVEKAQLKREGSSYLVVAVIGAVIEVYSARERNILTSAEGAIVKTQPQKLYSAVLFSGESEVEDDFDCAAEDILMPYAKAHVINCTCQSGRVELNGEIYLSLLALRDGKPVSLDRIIPFKSEIPCDDALLARKAFCRATVKEIGVEAKVNEEKGKCGVNVNIGLNISGRYYEEEEYTTITDAFSTDSNLNITFASEDVNPCTDMSVQSERVSGQCATKAKLDYTCAFLATAVPKAEFTKTPDGIEGSVTSILIYEQNGELRSTEVNMPFTAAISGDITGVAVCGVNLKQRSEGECEGEAVLKISTVEHALTNATYISGITEGDKKSVSNSAISVYLPQAGDDLWDTAKNLSAHPDDVAAANPDLTFPLNGSERIIVFRPKRD